MATSPDEQIVVIMPLFRFILLPGAFVVCCTLCCAQGQASNSIHQPDYPSGWEDLVSAWRQLEEAEYNETGSYVATVEKKIKIVGGGETARGTIVWSIRTKPEHKYITGTSETGVEAVYARSPNYAFLVQRSPGEQEWKLFHFTKASRSNNAHRFEERIPGAYSLSVLYPLGTLLENDRCSEYFYEKNRKEHLKELKLIVGEKKRLEWALDWGYHGFLAMDAPPNYIVRKFESTRNDIKTRPRRTTFVRELLVDRKRPTSPLPLCKSVAYKIVVNKEGGETLNDVRITFSDYSFDPPPDDIFHLSDYGLPESPAATKAISRNPWLWLLAVSLGCFTVAFLFRRLVRRKAQLPVTGEKS